MVDKGRGKLGGQGIVGENFHYWHTSGSLVYACRGPPRSYSCIMISNLCIMSSRLLATACLSWTPFRCLDLLTFPPLGHGRGNIVTRQAGALGDRGALDEGSEAGSAEGHVWGLGLEVGWI